jgi:hypothetical protein
MNERIKQLAEQAHFYQADDNYFTAAQEEFARLIIRECLDNCMAANDRDRIREHFGVKE